MSPLFSPPDPPTTPPVQLVAAAREIAESGDSLAPTLERLVEVAGLDTNDV
jgi:hypothetical protein